MKKLLIIAIVLGLPGSLANEKKEEYTFRMIKPPRVRLSNNWIFVIDTSDSMQRVSAKAMQAFRRATEYPTDDFRFQIRVFNDRGMDKHSKWYKASALSFKMAEEWIMKKKNSGVHSYGGPAIKKALYTPKNKLTIIIITDGGFTSASGNRGFKTVDKIIDEGQAWRVKKYGLAVIATIGIENNHYSVLCRKCCNPSSTKTHDYSVPDHWTTNIGGKPSDDRCQDFLRRIGVENGGGYYLVRKREYYDK